MCWSFYAPRVCKSLLLLLGLVLLIAPSAMALTISDIREREGSPGDDVQFNIRVTNNNNPSEAPRIWVLIEELDNPYPDFYITIEDPERAIESGSSTMYKIIIEIPSDADDGQYLFLLSLKERRDGEEYDDEHYDAMQLELNVASSPNSTTTGSTAYIAAGIAITGLGILEKKHYLLTAFGIIPAHWRIESEQVLDNEVRASVFEQVRTHDGISLSQITKKSALSKSTVRYALRVLLAFNYIIQGPNRYYYLPGQSTSHLTNTQTTILDKLVTKESYRQEDLARAVGMTRAGLTHQLDTLIRRGEVERIKRGRQVYYRPSGRGTPPEEESEPPGEHWWDKNSA